MDLVRFSTALKRPYGEACGWVWLGLAADSTVLAGAEYRYLLCTRPVIGQSVAELDDDQLLILPGWLGGECR